MADVERLWQMLRPYARSSVALWIGVRQSRSTITLSALSATRILTGVRREA